MLKLLYNTRVSAHFLQTKIPQKSTSNKTQTNKKTNPKPKIIQIPQIHPKHQ